MTFLHAILFGVVEGITEYLPISSTAHLILTAKLLGIAQTPFQETFEVVIQLGAILAVVVLYIRSLFLSKAVLLRIAVAFIPTAIIGFALHSVVKQLFQSDSVILWALLLGGVFLIVFEHFHRPSHDAHADIAAMPLWKAATIGLFQSLALVPGVSRSAATIIGGLLLGVSRPAIVEFSFVLAVPTMLAASGLDLLKTDATFGTREWELLGVGFVVSFIVALIAVRWFLKFIARNSFTVFGIYRVLLALAFFALLAETRVH